MKKAIDIDLIAERRTVTLDSRQINCYNEFIGKEEDPCESASREIREQRENARLGAVGMLIGLSGTVLLIAIFLIHLL